MIDQATDIVPVDELTTLMAAIENAHMRSNSDTGANATNILIWNSLREHIGYPDLNADVLRQRQIDSSPGTTETVESLRAFDEWYEDYILFMSFPYKQRRYDELVAAGGIDYLLSSLGNTNEKRNNG